MEADTVAGTEGGESEDGVEQSARARSKRVVNKQESNVRDLRLSFRRSAGTISRGKWSPSSMRPEHRHLSKHLPPVENKSD